MPDRRRLALALVAAGVGAGALAARWPGPIGLLVVGLYALAQVPLMPTPSGMGVSFTPAVAGGLALASGGSPILVLAAGAVALPMGVAATHLVRWGATARSRIPSEAAGVASFGAVFCAAVLLFPERQVDHPLVLAAFASSATIGLMVTTLLRAGAGGRLTPRRLLMVRAFADWPAYTVLYAAAAMFAITVPEMGAWSLLLAGLPTAFGYLAMMRLQRTRHTYRQTIHALGRIPEAGGLVADGHSERTAALATAVAAQLGLGGRALDRVEFAALLHGIGRLVLANPAVTAGEYSLADVSGWSAAIIGESEYLAEVAEIVAVMNSPYRQPGQERDRSLPVEAQVVRTASAFCDGSSEGAGPLEAMETLHRGAAYDFDPEVVAALRRVLEREGAIAG